MICNRCLHCDVCKFANAKINSDTKVKDIESNLAFSNCKDFIDKNNSEKCGEWISVKDGLPENGIGRPVVISDGKSYSLAVFSEGFWYAGRGTTFSEREIKYWMPLPEPPKGE